MSEHRVALVRTQSELEAAFDIRERVFVDEQGVAPDVEYDGKDTTAVHALGVVEGSPAGTARCRRIDASTGKIERVAVRPAYRRRGLGRALMQTMEGALATAGCEEIVLHAQRAVVSFYRELGYHRVGDSFEEAGIPHVGMRRTLSDPPVAVDLSTARNATALTDVTES